MGVQCGTLRGGGSLAYRTLEGGGAAPNTLLDVESTAQHLFLLHTLEERRDSPQFSTDSRVYCTALEGKGSNAAMLLAHRNALQ